jgi:hypothetical protein
MRHQIIETENYLLVVDDSEIKVSDWTYNPMKGLVFISSLGLMISVNSFTKKIIAHLPLNGAPGLEGVDLLPPIEDVEQLANIFSNGFQLHLKLETVKALREGFILGYNKAKDKYKYTEGDMRKAYEAAFVEAKKGCAIPYFDLYIQSIHQYPKAFQCEMEYKFPNGREYIQPTPDLIPKTTTINGHIVWVGKYIY